MLLPLLSAIANHGSAHLLNASKNPLPSEQQIMALARGPHPVLSAGEFLNQLPRSKRELTPLLQRSRATSFGLYATPPSSRTPGIESRILKASPSMAVAPPTLEWRRRWTTLGLLDMGSTGARRFLSWRARSHSLRRALATWEFITPSGYHG